MGIECSNGTPKDVPLFINRNYFLKEDEKKDIIEVIYHIEIDFFENELLQKMSNVVYIIGNRPKHEGLIIKTEKGIIYSAQFAPSLFFFKELDWETAVNNIKSCSTYNRNGYPSIKKFFPIKERKIPMESLVNIFGDFSKNEYSALGHNCQEFCDYIFDFFGWRYYSG